MSDVAHQSPETGQGSFDQWVKTARLISGLVLMTFVVLHFANHMLALISLDAAEAGRTWFVFMWRNPLGTLVFYGALLVHIALTLLALYRRRTLVMPVREAFQVALGLIIPVLIAEHVAGTRLYSSLSGVRDSYEFVANSLWLWAPAVGARQAFAVVAVWGHGCLGLFFWLRYKPWFPRVSGLLLILAAIVPVLTLLGFVNAGRMAAEREFTGAEGIDPAVIEQALTAKDRATGAVYGIYGSALVLVLALRFLCVWRERRNVIEVRYPEGRSVRVPKGYSVLEASRIGGIPHHSVCGGRGRCSTCRIKVLDGSEELPPIESAEQATLTRIHAEPEVRLACQLRPNHNLKVVPLLAAGTRFAMMATANAATPGREQDVAVLFCDIRSFTALADKRLPFDTVFLLNRYFALVGKAVEKAGGRLDKFIGDGAMAIFGLDVPRHEACRQAIVAAAAIIEGLAEMSKELAGELREPLRIAIGIHAGGAIAGTMGYGRVMGVTVIGDTVNIASRLESVAKELDAAIVVSAAAATLSGFDMSAYDHRTVDIRGHSKPLDVWVVPQGAHFDVGQLAGLTPQVDRERLPA